MDVEPGKTWCTDRAIEVVPEDVTRVALTLPTVTAGIEGRVRDAEGVGLSGVTVGIERHLALPAAPGLVPWTDAKGGATTDATGKYVFEGLPLGEYRIRASAPPPCGTVERRATAGASSVDFVLTPARALRLCGSVADVHGRPLVGVNVVPLTQPLDATRTEEDGRFALDLSGSAVTPWAVRFSLPGFTDHVLPIDPAGAAEGGSLRRNVRLGRCHAVGVVEGTTVSPRGEPLAGARVLLLSSTPRVHRQVRTDADGHYSFTRLPSGPAYRLRVSAGPSYFDEYVEPLAVAEEKVLLDLVLAPLERVRLRGTLRDPSGAPVPHFQGELRSRRAATLSCTLATDSEGRYDVRVPPGEIGMEMVASSLLTLSGLTLASREDHERDLVVDWGAESLHGTVHWPDDRPAPRVAVVLEWEGRFDGVTSRSRRSARTDADGRFRFTELGRGSHVLRVTAGEIRLEPTTVSVPPATGVLRIVLPRTP